MQFKLLVINPGSTSTKLCIFEDQVNVAAETVSHDAATITGFASLMDQLPMRLAIVKDFLVRHDVVLADLSAIACRGGLLRPLPSGTYRVDEAMVRDLYDPAMGAHHPIWQRASDSSCPGNGRSCIHCRFRCRGRTRPLARLSG